MRLIRSIFNVMCDWLINYTCTSFGNYWLKINTTFVAYGLLVEKLCYLYHRNYMSCTLSFILVSTVNITVLSQELSIFIDDLCFYFKSFC